jgi:hypothetical protein
MSHWPLPKLSRTSPNTVALTHKKIRLRRITPCRRLRWHPGTEYLVVSSWSQDRLHPGETQLLPVSFDRWLERPLFRTGERECCHVYTDCRSNTQVGKGPRTRQNHPRQSAADFEETGRVRGSDPSVSDTEPHQILD